jgi:hypothetical protein
MLKRLVVIGLALTFIASQPHAQVQGAAIQLKAAEHKARVEGDLPGAIELYRQAQIRAVIDRSRHERCWG